MMRINIMLDDKLVKEAFRYADVSSKSELITLVLREFVQNHRKMSREYLKSKVK